MMLKGGFGSWIMISIWIILKSGVRGQHAISKGVDIHREESQVLSERYATISWKERRC